ncbi:MAG: endonuclease, partial [Gaiellaceae bacterium]|nr:endonuclease [Gaiellaceae bacterium]
ERDIAETAITAAAVRLGSTSIARSAKVRGYDLIFDVCSRLLRVQCKWSARYGDVVVARCYSSRRIVGGGVASRGYTEAEIDVIAAYCDELETCYLLPRELWSGRRHLHRRLARSRNNQVLRTNWAKDFELAATLGRYGAIAQLGERLAGSQKVAGSSPAGSTDRLARRLAERGDFAPLRKPLERTGLDLPDALACQPELPPDLLE